MQEQCKNAGREIPESHQDITVKRVDLYNAFNFLSHRRAGEYQHVTDSDIMGYVNYYGSHGLHPNDFLNLVHNLDDHYLTERATKAKSDAAAAKQKGGRH